MKSRLGRRCAKAQRKHGGPRLVESRVRRSARHCRRAPGRIARPGACRATIAAIRRRRRQNRRKSPRNGAFDAIASAVPSPQAKGRLRPCNRRARRSCARRRLTRCGAAARTVERRPGQDLQPRSHQHGIAARIGDHMLDDAEAALAMRAGQLVGGYAVLERATSNSHSRFSSAKKFSPSVTMRPRSRRQAWSTRG